MSFIRDLNITPEEQEEQIRVAESKFVCETVSELLAFPARLSLTFSVIKPNGTSYTYLKVSWAHSVPQPFGVHVIPSGRWNVSRVQFSGALFKRACRLNTAIKTINQGKGDLFASPSRVSELEQEIVTLRDLVSSKDSEIERLQASASKAKAKLHDLRNLLDSYKQPNESVPTIDKGKAPQASTSAEAQPSNADIFKAWLGDGNTD